GPPPAATEYLRTDAAPLIDALRFFLGDVARVRALAPAAGALTLQLEFTAGAAATLTCATFARPDPRHEMELLRDECSLRFADGLRTLYLCEPDKTTILRSMNSAAAEATRAFLDAVQAGAPDAVSPGYGDALRTLAVCHAAALSVEEK